MPAASCPRCCRACRPSATIAAASGWPKMPKTPHSSCSRSSSRSKPGASADREGAFDGVLARFAGGVGPPIHHCLGTTAGAAGAGWGRFLLMSASSFCLSGCSRSPAISPSSARRPAGAGGGAAGLARVGAADSSAGSSFPGRMFAARLDPGVDRRRRVFRQQRDDLVRGIRQHRPRLGVFHPFRLLLVRDQPVEDREGDDREQKAPRDPEHKAQRPVERADLAVEDRVRHPDGEQRHHDQRGEEHDRGRDRLRDRSPCGYRARGRGRQPDRSNRRPPPRRPTRRSPGLRGRNRAASTAAPRRGRSRGRRDRDRRAFRKPRRDVRKPRDQPSPAPSGGAPYSQASPVRHPDRAGFAADRAEAAWTFASTPAAAISATSDATEPIGVWRRPARRPRPAATAGRKRS